jgi:hypothetical protein
VPFERARLAAAVGVLTVVAVGGELLLPQSGAVGLLARAALLAVTPALLMAAGVVRPGEVRALVARPRVADRD